MDYDYFPDERRNNSRPGEYSINCPFCEKRGMGEDRKHHLGFNVSKDVYYCFRCGASGRAVILLGERADKRSFFSTLTTRLQGGITSKSGTEFYSAVLDYDAVSTPLDWAVHKNAAEYLVSRGVTEKDVAYYDIRLGDHSSKLFRGRILVPTYDNLKNCVYLVGRDYCGKSDKRYINPPGTEKGRFLWNLNRIAEGDMVVLVEGVFDGIIADKAGREGDYFRSVCMFGKKISLLQARALAMKKPGTVVVALDADVKPAELDKNKKILKDNGIPNPILVKLPGDEDPASMGVVGFRKFMGQQMDYLLLR